MFAIFTDLSDEDRRIVLDNTFPFVLPVNYLENDRLRPLQDQLGIINNIPPIVAEAILRAMPSDIPIDGLNAFYHLRRGWLPNWTVIWMMKAQVGRQVSPTTQFYRALHLIESFREQHFYGDGGMDTAAVQPGHDQGGSQAEGQAEEEAKDKKGDNKPQDG